MTCDLCGEDHPLSQCPKWKPHLTMGHWRYRISPLEVDPKPKTKTQPVYDEKPCLNCGKEFVPRRYNARFCGHICRNRYNNKLRDELCR